MSGTRLVAAGLGGASRGKGGREDKDAEGKSSRKNDNRKKRGRDVGEWKKDVGL